jgi:hypothetical protein
MTDDEFIKNFTKIVQRHGKVTAHYYRPLRDCGWAGFWYGFGAIMGIGACICVGMILRVGIDLIRNLL